MVQGEYESAGERCSKVAKHGGFALGLACAGHLRLYTGQAEQGLALLAQIDSDAASLAPSFKAWVQGLLAEGAERLGQWSKAEAHYRKALGHAPHDKFLLVAYADFLLDRGRATEVLSAARRLRRLGHRLPPPRARACRARLAGGAALQVGDGRALRGVRAARRRIL